MASHGQYMRAQPGVTMCKALSALKQAVHCDARRATTVIEVYKAKHVFSAYPIRLGRRKYCGRPAIGACVDAWAAYGV